MFGIAVGQLGMSSDDFYDCTLVEVMAAINAFYELENNREAAEWERMRMLSFYTLKPHDSKRRIKKPKDLFSLPSDNKQEDKAELKAWLEERQKMAAENDRKRWLALNN